MKFAVENSRLSGTVTIPASKSHTIRGLVIAALAGSTSKLVRPLPSDDTQSCARTCRALGAEVNDESPECWSVTGTEGRPEGMGRTADVGNSGTTLFFALGAAALGKSLLELTGDEQVRRRSAAPLLEALRTLGATAYSRGGGGCAPLVVGGGIKGGTVTIECPTSQYMSSLLLSCPLAEGDTEISAPVLNERPYVEMTCAWLRELGIRFEGSEDLQHFHLPGGQRYPAFEKVIPADFSSGTFFMAAAALTGSELFLQGLDMNDTQGDKAVVGMLEAMGCEVGIEAGGIRIRGPEKLRGGTFDLNATPDALPAMAVVGCVAEGETRLVNVPQARLKETDRIAVMAQELRKLGADVEELRDGLIVRESRLKGTVLDGRGDHRVVMALAVAGLSAEGTTVVDAAEAVAITFPDFADLMQQAGANLKQVP